MVEDIEIVEDEQIKEEIVNFYTKQYKEEFDWRPSLGILSFSTIFMQQGEEPERPFEEDEMLGALKGCKGDKSSGLDG